MYSNDPKDLALSLRSMAQTAMAKTNANQVEARSLMRQYLAGDRRFDTYDHGRLVERVWDARGVPSLYKIEDPYLQRGGERRPLDRRWERE